MPLSLKQDMPEFKGIEEWINGQVSKQDLLGTPSIVQFWSISCGACKESLPKMKEWHEIHDENNLRLVGIHMPRSDEDKDIEKVKEIIDQYELTYPIAVDNQLEMTEAYDNMYVPAFYLFDEEGKLRHYQVGAKVKMLEQRLEKMTGVTV
ncbi:MAG: redoxin domain-containing protein [Bacillaceae bacterium]|nr:redoxin domain-containing protein [Bacillaceae bacterium]